MFASTLRRENEIPFSLSATNSSSSSTSSSTSSPSYPPHPPPHPPPLQPLSSLPQVDYPLWLISKVSTKPLYLCLCLSLSLSMSHFPIYYLCLCLTSPLFIFVCGCGCVFFHMVCLIAFLCMDHVCVYLHSKMTCAPAVLVCLPICLTVSSVFLSI